MSLLRVVLDSNVLVSAYSFRGVPGAVFDAARDGLIDGVVSLHILGEVRRVLVRPHLGYDQREADDFVSDIASFCDVLVTDRVPGAWCPDPDDDAIVQTAILAGASHVVTGDAHLLGMSVPRLRFVTPGELLDLAQQPTPATLRDR
jgi:putative PIN family toxin of toxin-antitoxin system